MTDKVSLGLLATGVPGLDELLGGGLSEFAFTLIAGAPGSGKTTLAHQIMFALATEQRKALFFTVLGEPPLKMLRYQQQYSFFDLDKVGTCVRYVNLAEDLRSGDFSGVLERIMREVEDFSPSLVFVDSFRSVVQTARTGNEGAADLQQFVQELGTRMTSWQATTFLIGEYVENDPVPNPIMTVADGMLLLSHAQEENSVIRKIRVFKMRGQAHITGAHVFRISGDGLHVFPRVLPPVATDHVYPGQDTDTNPRRIPSGTPGLDDLLHGGIPQGHSLLISGPTGCGKTIFGTRFLYEGAQRGEKGVLVSFEKGAARLRNAQLAAMVRQGDVAVVESRSLDLTVEELLDDLLRTIERTGATRIVIDAISELGLYLAPEARRDIRGAMFRVLSSLAKLGVTVVVTLGMEDRFTDLRFSHSDIAYLTDVVLAMRYVEKDGALHRVISVIKVRGSDHSHDLREFRITDAGIEVSATPLAAQGVLVGQPGPNGQQD
ncbi:AAA family ATPase [Massilia arenosa]|uniref:non-specific serine/threonine protein kinase n=1 Tax=Zemynaea arenosa TaxID=2561931 RepID=A0A4Y9S8M3_9BURK|nr:ATPase domain-containing protein [Massilia arenosa]TFW15884.1 AAA family ATPase [Massilia arenosa]